MEKLLISACILGINCKYNGKNNYNELVEELKKKYELIPVCPEVLGGLSIPRNPSEIKGNTVISNRGVDVTKEFNLGAKMAFNIAKDNNIKIALLKDGSPSCGKNYIYDGTFTKTKIKGYGIFSSLLINNEIEIYTENDIEELLKRTV